MGNDASILELNPHTHATLINWQAEYAHYIRTDKRPAFAKVLMVPTQHWLENCVCACCGEPFQAGDLIAEIVMGCSRRDRIDPVRLRAGQPYAATVLPVHYECATGEVYDHGKVGDRVERHTGQQQEH